MTDTSKRYLLVKRGLYWRPNAQGYTGIKAEAGVYSDAESIAYAETDSTDQTYRVLAADADDFAPACSDAERARHWQARAQAAEAELARLATVSPGHPRDQRDEAPLQPRPQDTSGDLGQHARTENASPLPRITDRERPVLQALHELTRPHGELCVPFRAISGEPSNSAATQEVRRIVRALARKGCAHFVRGLFDDAGEMRGSGYCITPTGIAALAPTRTPPAPVAPVELDPVLNAEKN